MTQPTSQSTEALACERLSEADLLQISGGVALVTGRIAQGLIVHVGRTVPGVPTSSVVYDYGRGPVEYRPR